MPPARRISRRGAGAFPPGRGSGHSGGFGQCLAGRPRGASPEHGLKSRIRLAEVVQQSGTREGLRQPVRQAAAGRMTAGERLDAREMGAKRHRRAVAVRDTGCGGIVLVAEDGGLVRELPDTAAPNEDEASGADESAFPSNPGNGGEFRCELFRSLRQPDPTIRQGFGLRQFRQEAVYRVRDLMRIVFILLRKIAQQRPRR